MTEESGDPTKRVARVFRMEIIANDAIEDIHLDNDGNNLVELDMDRLELLVDWHFEKVAEYKDTHNFDDGSLINLPKLSAISAIAILKHEPLVLMEGAEPNILSVTANAYLARAAMYSLNFIDTSIVPLDMDEAIFHSLYKGDIEADWMIISCQLLGDLYRKAEFKGIMASDG
jgi:hypothetical protein